MLNEIENAAIMSAMESALDNPIVEAPPVIVIETGDPNEGNYSMDDAQAPPATVEDAIAAEAPLTPEMILRALNDAGVPPTVAGVQAALGGKDASETPPAKKVASKRERRKARQAAASQDNVRLEDGSIGVEVIDPPAKKGKGKGKGKGKVAPPAVDKTQAPPRSTTWKAPTLAPTAIDRDFACVLLSLTALPQTMAQLVERAEALASVLGFKRYAAHEQEVRNRNEKCKLPHLRYKSYHDLTDSACKSGAIAKIRDGKRVTLTLGDKASEVLKPMRTARKELEAKRKANATA